MSTPYREDLSFPIARGPRAIAELHRAAHPWPIGWEVVVVIASIAFVSVLASRAEHDLYAFAIPAMLLFTAWTMAQRSRRTAAGAVPQDRTTTGSFDDEGVRIAASSGSFSFWSWSRIASARRTKTALALITDTELGIVILAEDVSNLDALAQFAVARAGAPWRSTSHWMVVVLLAYVATTCLALRPRSLATPLERIEDALDRGDAPAAADLEALGSGSVCRRLDLAELLERRHRLDLEPAYDDGERAMLLVARDLDDCDDGAITPRGRVLVEDLVVGECNYYAFTLRGDDQWALAGPYGLIIEPAWTWWAPGALDARGAIDAATSMHDSTFERDPVSPPTYEPSR